MKPVGDLEDYINETSLQKQIFWDFTGGVILISFQKTRLKR